MTDEWAREMDVKNLIMKQAKPKKQFSWLSLDVWLQNRTYQELL